MFTGSKHPQNILNDFENEIASKLAIRILSVRESLAVVLTIHCEFHSVYSHRTHLLFHTTMVIAISNATINCVCCQRVRNTYIFIAKNASSTWSLISSTNKLVWWATVNNILQSNQIYWVHFLSSVNSWLSGWPNRYAGYQFMNWSAIAWATGTLQSCRFTRWHRGREVWRGMFVLCCKCGSSWRPVRMACGCRSCCFPSWNAVDWVTWALRKPGEYSSADIALRPLK